jgi:hypothetical protein
MNELDNIVKESNLLGASIRIGAEIPRYNRDALTVVRKKSRDSLKLGHISPFVPNDLTEAIYHAIIGLFTGTFTGLELSKSYQIQHQTDPPLPKLTLESLPHPTGTYFTVSHF